MDDLEKYHKRKLHLMTKYPELSDIRDFDGVINEEFEKCCDGEITYDQLFIRIMKHLVQRCKYLEDSLVSLSLKNRKNN